MTAASAERRVRAHRGLAWAFLVGLALAVGIATAGLAFATPPAALDDPGLPLAETLAQLAIGVATAGVGALIVVREPKNPVGWIVYLGLLLANVRLLGLWYARYAIASGAALPLVPVFGWIQTWIGGLGVFSFGALLFLLFPSGRPLSRRWWWVAWATVLGLVLQVGGQALQPGPLRRLPTLTNPFGVELGADVFPIALDASESIASVCIVLSAGSLVLRYRRAHPDEQAQIRWLATAAPILAASFLVPGVIGAILRYTGYLAVPLAIAVAILRYRLYDIDLIINRALVYGGLTAILAGLYAGSIALFQRAFIALTGQPSDAAIVLTTLLLAASFTPIKNALQRFIDRRFVDVDAVATLHRIESEVTVVLDVIEGEGAIRRLMDGIVRVYRPDGAAIVLSSDDREDPIYLQGADPRASPALEIVLIAPNGLSRGRLVLGRRRSGGYGAADKEALAGVAHTLSRALDTRLSRPT